MLQSYVDQGDSFLIARVWLGGNGDSGDTAGTSDSGDTADTADTAEAGGAAPTWLPPLQLRYAATSLTLPLRLGALSSSGSQDLLLYSVLPHAQGSLAISNVPEAFPEDECLFVADGAHDFSSAYTERFDEAVAAAGGAGWALEYAWEPEQCDPCTAEPLTNEVIRTFAPGLTSNNAFFSRLHLRYTPATMTEDLALYPTRRTATDQMRYISYSTYTAAFFPVCDVGWVEGDASCDWQLGQGTSSGMCGAIPLFVVGAGALLQLRKRRARPTSG